MQNIWCLFQDKNSVICNLMGSSVSKNGKLKTGSDENVTGHVT